MPSLAEAQKANAATKLSYKPIALVVGGTSGIGKGTAQSLAQSVNGNIHLIICGRNEQAAKEVISQLPNNPSSTYEFLPCDATLMENVSAACKTLTSPGSPNYPLTKLNYLVMSPGFMSSAGFSPTTEGIDRKLAVHVYARWKFAEKLMPLLEEAAKNGEEARVVTILGAGKGKPMELDNLGLKKRYSVYKSGVISPTYNTLLVEEFAKRHPHVGFTHIYPGFVKTNYLGNAWWAGAVSTLLTPLATSEKDCGDWMARAVHDPSFAKGAHHLDNHADPVPSKKLHITPEAQKAFYDHFMEEVGKY